MQRIVLAAALLVVGVVVGFASVGVHATWWGLPLALVATAVTAYATERGWAGRLPFVLGWAGAVAALAMPTSEGDVMIAGNVNGYALVGFGLALIVVGFVTLPPPHVSAPTS